VIHPWIFGVRRIPSREVTQLAARGLPEAIDNLFVAQTDHNLRKRLRCYFLSIYSYSDCLAIKLCLLEFLPNPRADELRGRHAKLIEAIR
jgi:hypothetical protein